MQLIWKCYTNREAMKLAHNIGNALKKIMDATRGEKRHIHSFVLETSICDCKCKLMLYVLSNN